jgi:murein DD-endopeptidase MepM/ murein hydrolase activator NlpD
VRTALELPVRPGVVTSFFGLREDPFDGRERYHLGLDLEAEPGQVVLAARGGRVLSAGWAGGHGLRVEVAHGGDLVTSYSHLSEVLVEPGQDVAAGQVLARAGSTGRSTGPHLHFEVWREGEPEDPLELLSDAALEVRVTARP